MSDILTTLITILGAVALLVVAVALVVICGRR